MDHPRSEQLRPYSPDAAQVDAWAMEARQAVTKVRSLSKAVEDLVDSWQVSFRTLQLQELADLGGHISAPGDKNQVPDVAARAYSDVFKAYAQFMQRCIRSAAEDRRIERHRAQHLSIGKRLRVAFPAVARRCWTDDEMLMCRAVRRALDRNDGADNSTLDRWRNRITIDQGRVLISAVEVVQLYEKLRRNAERLINGVLNLPRYA